MVSSLWKSFLHDFASRLTYRVKWKNDSRRTWTVHLSLERALSLPLDEGALTALWRLALVFIVPCVTLSGLFYLYCYPDSEGSLLFSAFVGNTVKNRHGIPCFRLFGLPTKLLSSIFAKYYCYGFFNGTQIRIVRPQILSCPAWITVFLFQFRRAGTDPAISAPVSSTDERFIHWSLRRNPLGRKKSLARDRNYHGIVRAEICTQHEARGRNFSPWFIRYHLQPSPNIQYTSVFALLCVYLFRHRT